jgi:hypothetical protein
MDDMQETLEQLLMPICRLASKIKLEIRLGRRSIRRFMAVKLDLNLPYKHRRIVNMSATLGRLKDVQTDLLYAYVAGWLYRG